MHENQEKIEELAKKLVKLSIKYMTKGKNILNDLQEVVREAEKLGIRNEVDARAAELLLKS